MHWTFTRWDGKLFDTTPIFLLTTVRMLLCLLRDRDSYLLSLTSTIRPLEESSSLVLTIDRFASSTSKEASQERFTTRNVCRESSQCVSVVMRGSFYQALVRSNPCWYICPYLYINCVSRADDSNIRLWKTEASMPLGVVKPKEKLKLEYSQKLKERYSGSLIN